MNAFTVSDSNFNAMAFRELENWKDNEEELLDQADELFNDKQEEPYYD